MIRHHGGENMLPDEVTFEPVLTPAEREELSNLRYLLARLEELRDRGLITPEACATVASESCARCDQIALAGSYAAALGHCREVAEREPREALVWAARAVEIDPARVDAWENVIGLNWRLEHDDEAIAACARAAERFPRFQIELDRLRGQLESRTVARQQKAEETAPEPRHRRMGQSRTLGNQEPAGRSSDRTLPPGPHTPTRPRRRTCPGSVRRTTARAARSGARVLRGVGTAATRQCDMASMVGEHPASSRCATIGAAIGRTASRRGHPWR